jgi:hypothetical protein
MQLLHCAPAGFTKKNELFVGRLAMLGVAAAVANEVGNAGASGAHWCCRHAPHPMQSCSFAADLIADSLRCGQ